jgi:hypothetical protein
MSDYYVKPMTAEEKVLFLNAISKGQENLNTLGNGVSLCEEDGTWAGGLCFLSSDWTHYQYTEVGLGFVDSLKESKEWVRYWKEISEELFKSHPMFRIITPHTETCVDEEIINGLGPYDRFDLGSDGERFLFEKNYTNGLITGENVVPRVKTTITETSSSTVVLKTLSISLD